MPSFVPGRRAAPCALALWLPLAHSPDAIADPIRLDRSVVPLHQSIELRVDPNDERYVGSTRIRVRVESVKDVLLLHSRDVEIGSAFLIGSGGERPLAFEEGENGVGHFRPEARVEPGTYEIVIDFSNEFNTQAVALYRLESGGDWYAFTQFEDAEARKTFPCFDEPSFKLPWELTLIVPEAHLAVANTPIASESLANGWRRVRFNETRVLPAYLLALATGPLESVPIEGLSVPGRVITPHGGRGLTGEAVRVTPGILDALESYFGTPYPFEKLDLVAVPEFWPGAMENAGLVTFRESILLLDPDRMTIVQKQRLVTVIAHELAHQWFGNLVTMEWWDDLWLNEAFASWMEYKIPHELFPAYGVEVTRVQQAQRAMSTDTQTAARAIRQPVETVESLLQSADVLAYEKGQAVLRMFEEWMGPESFREGVRAYLDEHAWGNARGEDLWRALSNVSDLDVASAMSTFLDQGGLPFVELTPLGEGRVELRQSRFLRYGADLDPDAQSWSIPVRIRFADDEGIRSESLLLTEKRMTIDLGATGEIRWIHPNADETGYYRWRLPPEMLIALAEAGGDVLSPSEEVGLVSTAAALLESGHLHADDVLRFVSRYAENACSEGLEVVVARLAEFGDVFVTEETEDAWAGYVRSVLSPALVMIGRSPRPGEKESATVLRPDLIAILADEGNDVDLIAWARSEAERYLADPSALDPSLVSTCIRVAARGGDDALFDELVSRFEGASVPSDRNRFLRALGYFRDPALVERALAYAAEAPLRPQEMFSIPSGLSSERSLRDRVYDWTTTHYEALLSRIPPPLAAFLPFVASGCSLDRLERARAFFADPANERPGQPSELAKVAESVTDCAALREREGDRVDRFLLEHAAERPRIGNGGREAGRDRRQRGSAR